MTTLKSIFTKPVDRPIEGVIKADDEMSLHLEIEEYILTNEVEKRLEAFLEAYLNSKVVNGAWISGFFGSGKSHLLKMLALLLENRRIDGIAALDLFLSKCGENEILRGDLKRAAGIPSKSILFNIDQKADVISKTQIDALLAVFVKVFDEMCGYYGKQGHIAEFERDLDSRGLYEPFKKAYEVGAGRTWTKGREQALLETGNIAKAYAQVTGSDDATSLGILDKYRSQYRVSIEDFAGEVQAYLERQPPNFRLNFFVDEVGQYIANNVKLMTNLQTIAESLATKCNGRSWIIVTSQEDLDSVLGQEGQHQGSDFSKIKARFACETGKSPGRIKLTSKNVDEVIQKRLLSKTEQGVAILSEIYQAQMNNFKTLFDFVDGSRAYRNFQDLNNFVQSYPFIPYQFALFQSAIANLSQHNAFEGKHSSVGERSMLGVFQQVAIQIGEHAIGELATFDLMFEGVRTALKSNIQRAILQAEKHLDVPFAVRLLKILFLVKYVKEFKATPRNLCILMLEGFKQDLPGLRKNIEEALNLLEQQTYVQGNVELYEYLTDEEKDVEQEIKNTEVESTEVAAELEALIFDQVIKNRKIRYEENSQDYPYSRKLDDRLHGREYELAINVISPFHEHAGDEVFFRAQSMGRSELLVLMPQDERLIRDLLMYKRTEKYIRQTFSISQQDSIKNILNDKRNRNDERSNELKQRVQRLLCTSMLIVNGGTIDRSSGDAQTSIMHGFQRLVATSYPNLTMLRGVLFREDLIKNILTNRLGTLEGMDVTSLSEAEREMFSFVQRNNHGGIRTTVKHVLETFERKPNGWYFAAVICTLASLCARGKIEVRADGNLLDDKELEQALRNTQAHSNLLLEPQTEFTASQMRALIEFFSDFFDTPSQAGEARSLGTETGIALQELIGQLEKLEAQSTQYPFLQALTPVLGKLREFTRKPYSWYLQEFVCQKEDLLDLKEDVLDPVRKFMSGPQKDIFDNARRFVQTQEPNLDYVKAVDSDQWLVDSVKNALEDPDCFKGNRMQQVKSQVDVLQEKVTIQIDSEIAKAKETVAALKGRLCGMAEFGALNGEQQEQITRPFNEFNAAIERQKLIAVIRDTLRRFEESDYPQLLAQLSGKWEVGSGKQEEGKPAGGTNKTPHYPLVTIHSLKVPFSAAWLADETDVDRYLKSMREALLEEIRKGRRIQI